MGGGEEHGDQLAAVGCREAAGDCDPRLPAEPGPPAVGPPWPVVWSLAGPRCQRGGDAAQQDLQGGQSQQCQCGVVPGTAAGLAQPPRPQSGGDRGQGGLGWGEELDDDDVFLFGESCALN